MQSYFTDLHIHVGISETGKWIKIPTSRMLTVRSILEASLTRKGLGIIGIVDAMSPLVLQDIKALMAEGLLKELSGGGYRYKDQLTLLLGAEIETREEGGGLAHTLIYLPNISSMEEFSQYMAKYIRNINLSSQNAHMPLGKLVSIAGAFSAAIIPAHVFTPHKSVYGTCTKRLEYILSDKQLSMLSAIELGLSADTLLADRIEELAEFTFLTNSDAHSLDKIAREYNAFLLAQPTYQECLMAFTRKDGRQVKANYGLDPRLGKYHRTLCTTCETVFTQYYALCPHCGSSKLIKGVWERIQEISDRELPRHPSHRPPYYYQVPLQFIPGIGKKKLEKLLNECGSEMQVMHQADENELQSIVGQEIAGMIIQARKGNILISAGGGGVYGRVLKN